MQGVERGMGGGESDGFLVWRQIDAVKRQIYCSRVRILDGLTNADPAYRFPQPRASGHSQDPRDPVDLPDSRDLQAILLIIAGAIFGTGESHGPNYLYLLVKGFQVESRG